MAANLMINSSIDTTGQDNLNEDQLLLDLDENQMELVKALNRCDYKTLLMPPLQAYGSILGQSLPVL